MGVAFLLSCPSHFDPLITGVDGRDIVKFPALQPDFYSFAREDEISSRGEHTSTIALALASGRGRSWLPFKAKAK